MLQSFRDEVSLSEYIRSAIFRLVHHWSPASYLRSASVLCSILAYLKYRTQLTFTDHVLSFSAQRLPIYGEKSASLRLSLELYRTLSVYLLRFKGLTSYPMPDSDTPNVVVPEVSRSNYFEGSWW